MITVLVPECNQISQDYYDFIVNSLQFHMLKCSCGRSACLTVHAYYDRKVRCSHGIVILHVMRVKCSECGRTHAILLSSIVPYSQISLKDQCLIIDAFENSNDRNAVCQENPNVDENDVKHIIRQYVKHWLQRLLAESISLTPFRKLVTSCFSHYSAQFMQIRRTINIIGPSPTQHYPTAV